MPEGDTISRAARTMGRTLTGRTVIRFESTFPAVTRVDVDHPIAGRTIESVTSRGKHLLVAFSGGLVLHTHMRMNGSWHLYRPTDRWRRPRRDMRIFIGTPDVVAVAFNVPVAELLSARELAHHSALTALGPDLLDPNFDRAEALVRMRSQPDLSLGDVLLNQRVIAGIGNVLKSETLFLAGANPFVRVESLDEASLGKIVDVARDVIHLSASPNGVGRRTTRSMNPAETLWVYGRSGRPCRKCGSTIVANKTGPDARLTYWCPECQRTARL
jgi:endonuclease VIII